MKQELIEAIQAAAKKLFDVDVAPELSRPDEQFGDYATNIALQLSGKLSKNPREIAEALGAELTTHALVAEVNVAGPGFLNLRLSDDALIEQLNHTHQDINAGKRVLLEYSCPNAFKELHTGHLYQTVTGDALAKMFEATGATVYRANFGGDVGLHVAKCLYGIVQKLGGEYPGMLYEVPLDQRTAWISAAYVAGAKAYEEDTAAKSKIVEINGQIYAFHTLDDHETPLSQIYWECRDWSYTYFKEFYTSIKVAPFDKYYPESMTTNPGLEVVKANMPGVFEESDGAVVYKGEDAGLHTRVFVNSKGLPTYETKDLGVIVSEVKDFEYDKRIIMTGNEQSEYMKVVFAALNAIDADLAAKQTHLSHGTIRFGGGQKMSSRLGNVTRAVDVVNTVAGVVEADDEVTKREITLGAIKYSFLKHKLGGDISFDVNESVSMEGNSGPYLQYAHARARSILAKAVGALPLLIDIDAGERSLVRKLGEYNEIVNLAVNDLLPHYICTYLYELAQTFNRFYEGNRVIGDERESQRLALVAKYADTLKQGLALLGIDAPDRM
jgi:arginyl-tRNA synthetase